MSRAEELRAAGATVLADKSEGDALGRTPFIKWPANAPPAAWVEGQLLEIWAGRYGDNATIAVTGCSAGLTAGEGGPVTGRCNVGLSSATLKDRVTDEHVGEVLHFAFLGWVEPTNGGNRYRSFEIQVVPEELQPIHEVIPATPVVEDDGYSRDDELPF